MSRTIWFLSIFFLQQFLFTDHYLALAPSQKDKIVIRVVELPQRANIYEESMRECLEFADRTILLLADNRLELVYRAVLSRLLGLSRFGLYPTTWTSFKRSSTLGPLLIFQDKLQKQIDDDEQAVTEEGIFLYEFNRKTGDSSEANPLRAGRHELQAAKQSHNDWQRNQNVALMFACFVIALALLCIRSKRQRSFARKQLRKSKQLLELQKRLKSKRHLEAAGQLLCSVAHDFNNLLQIFSQHLELIRGSGTSNLTGDQLASVSIMEETLQLGSRMTGQLLTFSKKQKLEPVEMTIQELFDRAAFLFQSVGGGDFEINVQLENPDDIVSVDSVEFTNALMNLLFNARDASGRSGQINIRVSQSESGEAQRFVSVRVQDFGCGMNP
ncbi:MAG: hypothetical protein AAGA30_08070, partial [Planctomycetota bacterium]